MYTVTSSRRILLFLFLNFIYSFWPSDKHVTKRKWRNSCLVICANNKKNRFLSVWSGIYLKKQKQKKRCSLIIDLQVCGASQSHILPYRFSFILMLTCKRIPPKGRCSSIEWFGAILNKKKKKRRKNQKVMKSFQNKPQSLDGRERKCQCKQHIYHYLFILFCFPVSFHFTYPTRGI